MKDYFLEGIWRELVFHDKDLPVVRPQVDDEDVDFEKNLFRLSSPSKQTQSTSSSKRAKMTKTEQENELMIQKYLNYRRYAIKTPIENIEYDRWRNYSDNYYKYVFKYRQEDYHFARFLIRVLSLHKC